MKDFEVINFENMKKNALTKIDKSKKGDIDERIKKVLDRINKTDNYFTTSSCSGRIVLLKKGERKNECEWLYVTHDLADKKKIWKALQKAKGNVFLKMESLILHISCRKLSDAEKLLLLIRKKFKRAGIISMKKLSIELMGSDLLNLPVVEDKLLIDQNYSEILIDEANKKMISNWKKIEELYELLENC